MQLQESSSSSAAAAVAAATAAAATAAAALMFALMVLAATGLRVATPAVWSCRLGALQPPALTQRLGAIKAEEEAPTADAPPPRFTELLRFTILAMPIYVAPTLLSLIDTAAVGQVSSTALAALGPACAICDGISTLMVFISVGTTNAVSTAISKGDPGAAKRAASVSVVVAFAIGCLCSLLLASSIGPAIARLALPAALASTCARTGGDAAAAIVTRQCWVECERYVYIRALSFPFSLTLLASQAACLGAKDSLSPTLATLTASVVNVVGDAVLVLGPLALGIAGAAWATVGCQVGSHHDDQPP